MSVDVSIIIPTHNRLWALPQAVASCRGAGCETEIIVADDGSTDGTRAWLQNQLDVQATCSHQWGKPWAVNRAFQQAEGRYVRFLDSDDWLPGNVIDEQLQIAEREKADVVVAGKDIYRNDAWVEMQGWVHCDDFIAQQLGECDSSHYSAFLFRKSFIDDVPHRTSFAAPDFAQRDDRCFMIEVALKEPHVSVYHKSGLCHREHHPGERLQFRQGMRQTGTNLQHLLIYKQTLRTLAERGELTPRRKKAACNVLWPLAHWIARTHPEEATQVAAWVYRLNPDFEPPNGGAMGWCYEHLGFQKTERLLRARRLLLSPFRDMPTPSHNLPS